MVAGNSRAVKARCEPLRELPREPGARSGIALLEPYGTTNAKFTSCNGELKMKIAYPKFEHIVALNTLGFAAVKPQGGGGWGTTFTHESLTLPQRRQKIAFTLVEVVVAVAIIALLFGGIISANITLTQRAEWSGQSLAAQAQATQQLEQARSAMWDDSIAKNEMTNLNLMAWTYNAATGVGSGYSWTNLDLPITGTNAIPATNYVSFRVLTNVTGLAAVKLQMVKVDVVWNFRGFGSSRLYTNTLATYYAPDNIDPSAL